MITPPQSDFLTRIEYLCDSGDFDQAHRDIEQVFASSQLGEVAFTEAHLAQALVARRVGDYDRALHMSNEALRLADEYGHLWCHAEALRVLGAVHHKRGDYQQAQDCLLEALRRHEESGSCVDTAKVYMVLAVLHSDQGKFARALEYNEHALQLCTETNEEAYIATILANMGIVYRNMGQHSTALECYERALVVYEKLGLKSDVARVLGNIGIVYSHLELFDKAFEYYTTALAVHEELGAKSNIANVNGSLGGLLFEMQNYEEALQHFAKALAIHQETGERSGVIRDIGNMGEVHLRIGNYEKAHECFVEALAGHQSLGEKRGVALITGNLGALYAKSSYSKHDLAKAEEYIERAITLSEEQGIRQSLYEFHKMLADLLSMTGRKDRAYDHFRTFYDLEKEVLSEHAKKLADRLAFERKEAEREKQLAVERARAQAADSILANILPSSITDRLMKGEKKIADTHESVTVLFLDIVGFTKLTVQLPAKDLIELLDRVFSRFDSICKRHGLEKIKTIGDAYMAACGAPLFREDHAECCAQAALEMLEQFSDVGTTTLPIKLGFRIGLHTGSVVAGIIGENKYSYDLWGDAVNTASRMESHGEENRIHVSETFYSIVSQSALAPSLCFEERGTIDVRGKGQMKTYFLSRA